jgi:hypothetical protein
MKRIGLLCDPAPIYSRPIGFSMHGISFSRHRNCRSKNAIFDRYSIIYRYFRVDLLLSTKYIYSVEVSLAFSYISAAFVWEAF